MKPPYDSLDDGFREAVAAMDAGNVARVEHLLIERPELAHERLEKPGAWLRDKVGGALDSFFARPYLLWFIDQDEKQFREIAAYLRSREQRTR